MAREDFQPSDALPPTGQDRRPLAGIGYFLPMTVPKTTPFGEVGLSDIQMGIPPALKDAYSGIMKFGALMRGELSPQEIQQLAFDTSMNVTGGTLLGSQLLPKAVPKGALGMATSKFVSKSDTPQDVFHYSPNVETGFTVFDPDKAPSALDALGTHVGSPKAARDRFKALRPGQDRFATGNLGYDEAGIPIPRTTFGGTYPLKADLSKPYTPKGKAGSRVKDIDVWDEEGINMHLLIEYNKDRFGDAYSPKAFDMGHLVGDKPNFPFDDFRKFIGEFRKKLAEEGFTHLPYYNAVEDAGSLSYVMLTDRPKGSKAVLKGRFGKNDPRERTNPDIMKAGGGVISLKDKAVNMNRGPQGIEPFIKFMV